MVVADGDENPENETALGAGASPPVSDEPHPPWPGVILTPDQRVRVFISSTLEELAPERAAARRAIQRLHLVPVYYESGARPHPPRSMYRAYLEQSQIFVGIYWQRYGWVAPGMDISGLEDEYRLAAGKPMLLYLKRPESGQEPRLAAMFDSIRAAGTTSYRMFATARELERLVADDLAVLLSESFAGAAAGAERTGNLPIQATTFIGRAREKSDVRALVASSRLVTLTGAGGCGKTRLSLEVAAELAGGCGDGAWLVELAAVSDEGMVASAISQALGMDGQPGRPVVETLLDALAPQDTLIVLDNCEHLIGGCAEVAHAIVGHCPKVRLLATSREPLSIGAESIYRVPPLSLPEPADDSSAAPASCDAVALFADRASKQGVPLVIDDQTAPLVVSICKQLDGLPLAIELAAARLRSLSLSGLAARLDQRFRLLTGGSRTAPQRQQTLRATIDWSYSLLHGAEQVLLRRLSVFAESFDLDAAEAVGGFGGIDVFDITDLLGSLVDKSLVVAEPAGEALRYRLLETIRQFAAARLAEAADDEAAAAEAAHRACYLSVAETAAPHLTGPQQGRWLARLDLDQANLRRAAESAARNPDETAQGLRLGVALKRYWITRSRVGEGLALLMQVLDRPEARADPHLLGAALATAASHANRFGDIARARQLAEQAVTVARQLDDDRLLIESLGTLSFADYLAGDSEHGLPAGQEAVERARQSGDDVLLGESLTNYPLLEDLAELPDTTPLFDEAIAATTRSGDHLYAGYVNSQAALHALRAGDIPAARNYLEEAARAMQEIGHRGRQLLINLGWVLRRTNDPEGARSSFESALRASRHNGERPATAYASLGLACLAADAGDWRRAAVLHGIAQAFLDPTKQPWEELEAGYREDSLANVRANLGQEQFDRAYAEGTAISFDAAIDVAFGKAKPDRRDGRI